MKIRRGVTRCLAPRSQRFLEKNSTPLKTHKPNVDLCRLVTWLSISLNRFIRDVCPPECGACAVPGSRLSVHPLNLIPLLTFSRTTTVATLPALD